MIRIIQDQAWVWRRLDARIEGLSTDITTLVELEPTCARLKTLPGTRPITSSVMLAAIGTGDVFSKGCNFAAYVTGQGIACNANAKLDTLMQERKPTDRRKPLRRAAGHTSCSRAESGALSLIGRCGAEQLRELVEVRGRDVGDGPVCDPVLHPAIHVISVDRARYRCRIGAARRGYCREAY